MKPVREFLVHVELHGLFSVFVYPSPEGATLEFFPYPPTEKDFANYLVTRFGHLGEPADCVYDPEVKAYRAFFRGLHFKSPEEALTRLTAR